jgi:hypothetical protein
MPPFTLRFANRSTSTQDWIIQNLDQFTLQPDFVRSANVNLNNNYTFNIAANTVNTFAAASLVYTAGTNTWALNSLTPNEWQLAAAAGVVTVRCLLNATANAQIDRSIGFTPSEAVADSSA